MSLPLLDQNRMHLPVQVSRGIAIPRSRRECELRHQNRRIARRDMNQNQDIKENTKHGLSRRLKRALKQPKLEPYPNKNTYHPRCRVLAENQHADDEVIPIP